MLYEMRTYTLVPGGVGEFEQNFSKVVDKRAKMSPLVGFFHCEIGELNRVMHIWSYESAEQRDQVRAEVVKQSWWPPANGHLMLKQETKFLSSPPFRPEPCTGALGGVYEFRTYTVKPGQTKEVIARWTQHLGPREELSPLAACFTTESGPLNQFIHVWPYRDLNHRVEVRAASQKLPNWPPGSRPFLSHQLTEIWIPAAFSPMH